MLLQDMSLLIEAMQASQGCLLLLVLKDYLKDSYGELALINYYYYYKPIYTPLYKSNN